MLCSIPSSGKSTSNWLARLRSSKGFPSDTDADLDHFLTHHLNHNHHNDDPDSSSPPKPVVPPKTKTGPLGDPPEIPNPSQGKHLMFNLMGNVLAELFIMGGDSGGLPQFRPAQKSSRKQPNPRFCDPLNFPRCSNLDSNSCTPNDSAGNDELPGSKGSASLVIDDNIGVGSMKLVENVICGEEEEEEEEGEKDKGYSNLSGFSRTEVTVIDTSFAGWKFEKMLFRKKNVWKVREKKGKTANFTKKKRKLAENVNYDGEIKKPKVLDGQCGLSEKGDQGTPKEDHHNSNISETASAKIPDACGKAMKKKRATLNSVKRSSSVVLIKSIPVGRKVGTRIPKSCPKPTQKQFN